MVKKIGLYGIVLALLLPLLFINIKNSHDWGDDFAQYIHQAQNILIGQSQNNTGYIYNDNYFIGPTAYPTGFPLLLAVFSKFSDDNLMSLNKLISLFWMLGCFVGFLFFRKHFSYLTALITTLIIAYNPMMIQFKTEILSDLPFMFFSLLSLYLIDKEEKLWLAIATGLLIAFTVHIRSIGFILLGVLIVYKLLNTRKTSEANPYKFLIITLTSFLVLYFGLNLAFPCETNYPGLFDTPAPGIPYPGRCGRWCPAVAAADARHFAMPGGSTLPFVQPPVTSPAGDGCDDPSPSPGNGVCQPL